MTKKSEKAVSRRSFLKAAGVGAVATALAPGYTPQAKGAQFFTAVPFGFTYDQMMD